MNSILFLMLADLGIKGFRKKYEPLRINSIIYNILYLNVSLGKPISLECIDENNIINITTQFHI